MTRSRLMILMVLGLGAARGTAWAHPLLDEAERQFRQADFEGASETLARAESGTDLTREDLLELFVQRARVAVALHDDLAARRELRLVLSVHPGYELSDAHAPSFRALFEAVRADGSPPIRLHVEARPSEGKLLLVAETLDDTEHLVKEIRLMWRLPGQPWIVGARFAGRWVARAEGELSLEQGASAEYYAEVVGPGGAILLRQGSPDAPELFSTSAPPAVSLVPSGELPPAAELAQAEQEPRRPARPRPASRRRGLWIGVGVGVATLVAGALTVAFVASRPPTTVIAAPDFE